MIWYVNIFVLDRFNIGTGSKVLYVFSSNIFKLQPLSINMFISLLPMFIGYLLSVDLCFILNIWTSSSISSLLELFLTWLTDCWLLLTFVLQYFAKCPSFPHFRRFLPCVHLQLCDKCPFFPHRVHVFFLECECLYVFL